MHCNEFSRKHFYLSNMLSESRRIYFLRNTLQDKIKTFIILKFVKSDSDIFFVQCPKKLRYKSNITMVLMTGKSLQKMCSPIRSLTNICKLTQGYVNLAIFNNFNSNTCNDNILFSQSIIIHYTTSNNIIEDHNGDNIDNIN